MYVLLFVLFSLPGLVACRRALGKGNLRMLAKGLVLLMIAPVFFAMLSLWGDWLWFQSLGYEARFWRLIAATLLACILGAGVCGIFAFLLTLRAGSHLRTLASLFGAALGAARGMTHTDLLLLFIYGSETSVTEPVFGRATSFYLFALPFLDAVFWLLLPIALLCVIAVLVVWEKGGSLRLRHFNEQEGDPAVVPLANAGLAWILTAGMIISIYHLLYSNWGVVQGPGWIDINVIYPALIMMAIAFLLAGLLPLFAPFRAFMTRLLQPIVHIERPAVAAMSVVWSAIVATTVTVLVLVPALLQWLVVKPNEITFEKPYIAHNIEFTRKAFRLDNMEERPFTPRPFSAEIADGNRNLLSEVRLWDWRALDAVYRQFQEIRLYYEFVDVDIDRYTIDDRYRLLMVSAREMGLRNLSPESQTFVNKRFKYTHGYGYTAATVSDFTEEGLPNLLVQDIPPRALAPELEVVRPEIYFGELTTEAAVVNTLEEEFDYPSGNTNIYTRYSGTGGVVLKNLWRKFVFSWKLDGTVLLFSGYPTDESRILYRRDLPTRLEKIAPFLTFDEDPYLVAENGRLYWIIDAYTTSSFYPYSEPFDSRGEGERTVRRLDGKNYVRNAVKAVVDAYNGTVEFYIFDEDDPIIQSWQDVFPGLFKPKDDMPASLRRHVRYPQDFLLVQGLIYNKYHMSDPEVFYNQEDLWMRATEKHYGDIVPVDPYYVMWELPGSSEIEFVLILPFTPKNKQVLIGWIAGLSDGDNYGRFLAYNFPKEQRMLGPQQVETKIDQDPFLSGQLTLWDQQGSEVIRGNVLAIPVDDALIYVEPIYLRAETAAYPELRLVAVMHGDKLSYAENFEDALAGLFDDSDRSIEDTSLKDLARQARRAFDHYLTAQGDGRFADGAAALERLQALLNNMVARKHDD
jgi:uncharacterized membrane protein (UPF0182 family)